MIGRFFRYLLATILVAGLVHIVAILETPSYAPDTAFSRIVATTPAGRVSLIDPAHPLLSRLDPAFVHAVCPIGEGDRPVRLAGQMPDDYWSIAVIAETGVVVSTLTREDVASGAVDLIAGSSDALYGERVPEGEVAVPLPGERGFYLVKTIVPARNARPDVEAALTRLACAPPAAVK